MVSVAQPVRCKNLPTCCGGHSYSQRSVSARPPQGLRLLRVLLARDRAVPVDPGRRPTGALLRTRLKDCQRRAVIAVGAYIWLIAGTPIQDAPVLACRLRLEDSLGKNSR